MLSKLVLLLQSKTALAALGVLVVGSSGTAIAVTAASGHMPFTNTSMPAAQTSTTGDTATMPPTQQTTTPDAMAVAIDGVLTATASATMGGSATATTAAGAMTAAQPPITSISVEPPGGGKLVTILVNAQTRVTGQAHTLVQLTKYRGHRVQVQADKTGNMLTARKVTVTGMAAGGTPTPGTGAGTGTPGAGQGTGTAGSQNGAGGQQEEVRGTVVSVSARTASFLVRVSDATFIRVTVTPQTQFSGTVTMLSALKTGTHVVVSGTMQANGMLAAMAVQSVPR